MAQKLLWLHTIGVQHLIQNNSSYNKALDITVMANLFIPTQFLNPICSYQFS